MNCENCGHEVSAFPKGPLTPTERETYDFIAEYTRQHGYAPTLSEVCQKFGLRSPSSAHERIEGLQRKGWIYKREHNAQRAIELV